MEEHKRNVFKQLLLTRVRDVKMIERGTEQSAGVDFFVPKFNEKFLFDLGMKNPNISQIRPDNYSYYIVNNDETNTHEILLSPGERILIPSGIKVNLDSNSALVMFNKSGVATKRGLVAGASVVDEDYMGEIHLHLINTSNNIIAIKENDKILQGLLLDVSYRMPFEILTETELYESKQSERGDGGFGSTNK